jgi:hypothetical protein
MNLKTEVEKRSAALPQARPSLTGGPQDAPEQSLTGLNSAGTTPLSPSPSDWKRQHKSWSAEAGSRDVPHPASLDVAQQYEAMLSQSQASNSKTKAPSPSPSDWRTPAEPWRAETTPSSPPSERAGKTWIAKLLGWGLPLSAAGVLLFTIIHYFLS